MVQGQVVSVDGEDLLEFFYVCPVGLIEADEGGRVDRVNPAAVRLLAPVHPGSRFDDLYAALDGVVPDAVELVRGQPDTVGSLCGGRPVLAATATSLDDGPVVAVDLVRIRSGRLMAVVEDVTAQMAAVTSQRDRARHLHQRLLDVANSNGRDGLGLDGGSPPGVLQLTITAIADMVGADWGALLRDDDGGRRWRVRAWAGDVPDWLAIGELPDDAGVGTAGVVDTRGDGRALALPVPGRLPGAGLVVLGRNAHRAAFSPLDVHTAREFIGHAVLALELDDAQDARQRLAELSARDRTVQATYDEVIQRLFSAGLALQSYVYTEWGGRGDPRLVAQIDAIDALIRMVRTTAFDPVEEPRVAASDRR